MVYMQTVIMLTGDICTYNYLLSLKRTPPRAEGGEGFYYLASWPQENRLFEDMRTSPKTLNLNSLGQGLWTASTRPSTEPVSNPIPW